MKLAKNKNIKWWLGTIACIVLFFIIGTFAYMKMGFLINGVHITVNVHHTSSSPLIEVSGNAKNAVYLSLNGREIYIDKDGTFTEPVALLPGLSVLTIDAQDKFGKTREKKIELIYQESTGAVAWNNIITNTN